MAKKRIKEKTQTELAAEWKRSGERIAEFAELVKKEHPQIYAKIISINGAVIKKPHA